MALPTHYAALSSYLGDHVTAEEHVLRAYEDLLRERSDDAASRTWRTAKGERKLWAMLVRTAEIDAKKHIRVLRCPRTLLREAPHRSAPLASSHP